MAVDASGTPTSPDAIPTYNTAADNPSGKGLNNIVAAVQTALSNRASKPAGIVSGEVPVWNGTTWVRSSVTSINYRGVQQRPAMTGTRVANQSIPNNTGTQVSFDTLETLSDPFGVLSLNTLTGAITVNESGWYIITGTLVFAAGAGTSRVIQLLSGGVEFARGFQTNGLANSSTAGVIHIASGTVLSVFAFQDSGGALNITARFGLAQVTLG